MNTKKIIFLKHTKTSKNNQYTDNFGEQGQPLFLTKSYSINNEISSIEKLYFFVNQFNICSRYWKGSIQNDLFVINLSQFSCKNVVELITKAENEISEFTTNMINSACFYFKLLTHYFDKNSDDYTINSKHELDEELKAILYKLENSKTDD